MRAVIHALWDWHRHPYRATESSIWNQGISSEPGPPVSEDVECARCSAIEGNGGKKLKMFYRGDRLW